MSEAVAEKIEAKHADLLDIVDGDLKFHWTEVENLPRILKKGFYSEQFARKIGDDTFKRRSKDFMHEVDQRYTNVATHPRPKIDIDLEKGVGVVVYDERPRNIYFRLAPRKFVGLVIYDEPEHGGPNWSDQASVDRRLNKIIRIIEEEKGDLPVYGTSGNLYWPNRISYEEILEQLGRKDEVQ